MSTFLYQVETVNSKENKQLKKLEKEILEEKNKNIALNEKMNLILKEIQEEKSKNIALNEKINLIMNDLKEIKSKICETKNGASTPK